MGCFGCWAFRKIKRPTRERRRFRVRSNPVLAGGEEAEATLDIQAPGFLHHRKVDFGAERRRGLIGRAVFDVVFSAGEQVAVGLDPLGLVDRDCPVENWRQWLEHFDSARGLGWQLNTARTAGYFSPDHCQLFLASATSPNIILP